MYYMLHRSSRQQGSSAVVLLTSGLIDSTAGSAETHKLRPCISSAHKVRPVGLNKSQRPAKPTRSQGRISTLSGPAG